MAACIGQRPGSMTRLMLMTVRVVCHVGDLCTCVCVWGGGGVSVRSSMRVPSCESFTQLSVFHAIYHVQEERRPCNLLHGVNSFRLVHGPGTFHVGLVHNFWDARSVAAGLCFAHQVYVVAELVRRTRRKETREQCDWYTRPGWPSGT